MADISKVKLPDGSTYDIKDATARSDITKKVDKNQNNTVYTSVGQGYIGSSGSKKYWKITIPNIATRWTIISLYINLMQTYSNGTGGSLIINAYHNATSPYPWSGFTYSLLGYISTGIKVYGSGGDTFYIEGANNYVAIDIDKILVSDSARGYDISDVTVERTEELPETYQTASLRQSPNVGDSDNGAITTFAYSKAGLDSASWLAAWNGYELRAISPSKVIAGNVSGTVAVVNGGTGKTTANDAANNLISGLPAWTANPTDDTYFVRQDTSGTSTFGRVKFSTLWNYIKGKFSGTSPITFNNGTIGINTASTSAYGATKLSTATNSTATDVAATPSAVKTAYDLANTANGTANSALSGVNGNLIYDHTFTISNGIATFTPHVYQKGTEVTSNYAASCFAWKYRLINGTEVNLTTKSDRGCDVTISNLGYGGHVIGIFTPPA